MYTNIDTNHATKVIGEWSDSLKHQLPANFPLNTVKESMAIVMENNILEWVYLYSLQLYLERQWLPPQPA